MSEDITNIRLSAKATDIVEKIFDETQFFDDKITIAKFAMAYAIKNHLDNINVDEINNRSDSTGLNYNVGSIDSDRFIANLILALYPNTTTPYKIIRAFMIFGLEKLGECYDRGTILPISDLL